MKGWQGRPGFAGAGLNGDCVWGGWVPRLYRGVWFGKELDFMGGGVRVESEGFAEGCGK